MSPTAARPNLTQGSILKALLTLALPIVFGNLLQTGYQLVDAFWVGRLGASAVAAVAVSFPVNFLLIALGSGFSVAGSVLVAQNYGARNLPMVNHIAAQTLMLETGLALLLTAVAHWGSPLILRLIGVGPDIFEQANQFQRILFLGLGFNFGFLMFQALMRGVGEVRIPLYINIGTLALNFLLDPLFIYGWGPVPPFGVAGAAVATLVTQALSVVVGMVVLLRGRSGIQLTFKGFKPDFALMRRAVKLGVPSSIELSARALGLSMMTVLAAAFGTTVLATYGIGSRILALGIIPALGISLACSTLVAQNIGARNLPRAVRTANYAIAISFGGLLVVGLLGYLAAGPLVCFFLKGDEAVSQDAIEFVRIAVFSLCFTGAQQSVSGALRGSGNTLSAMMLTIIGVWVFQFTVAWYLSQHTALGFHGLWWSFVVANVLAATLALLWYLRGDWKGSDLADPLQGRANQAAQLEDKP
ncbi:MATE family efflux transporter [Hymenobacter properus]|uniref:Multidrug-efflux transporter n=1 Tax=Hymenobacter properus TaxID=2791026 RepID=A0A931BBZ4_9BACT|nr:MATE family efflux transporter [Hymenobacter properus]MBF9140964.1 MATE family efflux transporter [Hymenobacter properus]MBR7719773.1 MATE family efflux transporter [Microvirga sp. SRT04]